ncbi:hypothetical protein [Fischerella sp. JS2]|uniref:hypothetical protein n=1 Tax=Fischerella sp. JS2 TaxID=2597771 RepID=UPI0028F05FF3|nr:hypothetical protein [Fischerella sp. JS2]
MKHWHSLSLLLGLVLPGMWLVSGLLISWILRMPFWVGILIGAIIASTDPVVATSIVTKVIAILILRRQPILLFLNRWIKPLHVLAHGQTMGKVVM